MIQIGAETDVTCLKSNSENETVCITKTDIQSQNENGK